VIDGFELPGERLVAVAKAHNIPTFDVNRVLMRIPLKTATHSGSKPPAIAIQKRH
jgi:hypothetical protein